MSFFPTAVRCSKKLPPSSRNWLARQFKDPVVKQRLSHPAHYRSRSAFKLLELETRFKFLRHHDVQVVVDLGAAPGGWSQVVAGKLGWTVEDVAPTHRHPGRGVVVAVDLLPMFPIPGVKTLQTNFLSPEADEYIEALLPRPDLSRHWPTVDVILSDMAANFSGNRTADIESGLQICETVMKFTKRHLRTGREMGRRKGGVLVMKHFAHPLLQKFRKEELEPRFESVMYFKPPSSRDDSSEGYWVCQGWNGEQKQNR
ncbi:hypothetical protein PHLGIDRAFT_491464 [Phlebiopsis gigantea 11061_1 CR5-6]|uniref:rRNA methyltransferase 2, mitochondrial n=1 Tax=Phlebiopsis gigantea (strain 11061_1 CR5-6) TaxID=745531 RepID=A0A0C3RV33_PHLG1|nr:hypothetical protein PHLGIDRAFT_491464 [Phlebiopsis gigantea 11061_1 CR5-6]